MVASLPNNKSEWLEALSRPKMLDIAPNAEFDDLARLAAFVCGAPIAAVISDDSSQQWFRSIVGLKATMTPDAVAFCARLISDSELTIVPDVRLDPRFADEAIFTGAPHICFYAGAPLTSNDGEVIGVLCVLDYVARTLTAEQGDALKALARQVSHRIGTLRAVSELEQLVVEKEQLIRERERAEFALDRSFAALAESEERLRRLTDAAFEGIILSQNSALLDVSPACATLFGYASPGEMVGLPGERLPAPESRAVVARAVTTGDERPYEALLVRRDGTKFRAELRGREIHIDGKVARITAVRDISEQRAAEERIRSYALELESQKVELEAANALLAGLAITDGLTNLRNHRAFQERLSAEVDRLRRNGAPLSLILLDVDDFKQFNDEYGHPAGDAVLKIVAEILKQCVPESDLAARYGGEEFVIILPEVDADNASIYAERIRATIERNDWTLRPVTASFGVATLNSADTNAADLTARADRALYQSKANGRNRVSAA